jgi:glycosyltransferase involved in cell wall biosynthesis
MRILLMSNCPLLESQGSGYVIVNFMRGLQGLGHEVDAFEPHEFEWWQRWGGRAKHYRVALGMAVWTLRQLGRRRYDMVEFYGAEAWLAVLLVRWWWRDRILLVSHSNGIEPQFYEVMQAHQTLLQTPRRWYQLNQNGWFRYAFSAVHGVVTQSDYDRTYAIQHRYQDPDHVRTISSGLLPHYLGRAVNYDRDPVIGFCGSWIPRKGITTIGRDVGQILLDFPGVRLQLIGVGREVDLAAYFPAATLGQIEVIPFVLDKAKLADYYHGISILIMPSIYESFGLVAAEAMACGCTVVATAVGIIAQCDQDMVWLLPSPGSPHLYRALAALLHDDPLRRRLAQRGYRVVQGLAWETAIATLDQTYHHWHSELQP